MAYELVEEILDHAPSDLGPTETLILVAIAEKARKGSRSADIPAMELARRARVSTDGLKKAFQRLKKRGIDLRVVIGVEKNTGRPIYAVPGRVSSYQIPVFEAPENCSCHRCSLGGKITLLPGKEGRTSRQGGLEYPQGGTGVPGRGDVRPPHPSGETEGLSPDRSEKPPNAISVVRNPETMDRETAMSDMRASISRSPLLRSNLKRSNRQGRQSE